VVWSVYILRCQGGTLYTGIATDVARRVREHNRGKGARYTKSRGPVELVYLEPVGTRSQALRRELAIKRLRREEKLELVNP
jgi:putative endonuclease